LIPRFNFLTTDLRDSSVQTKSKSAEKPPKTRQYVKSREVGVIKRKKPKVIAVTKDRDDVSEPASPTRPDTKQKDDEEENKKVAKGDFVPIKSNIELQVFLNDQRIPKLSERNRPTPSKSITLNK
jgi:hypothetical protein